MRRLFYHGIEWFYSYGNGKEDWFDTIEQMTTIIESGSIKTRSHVQEQKGREGKPELNHVCLYRKNEDFDYDSENNLIKSARAGWIDHCLVFVISDKIDASKAECGETPTAVTNLVDEWRCSNDIPMSKVLGIAIPLDSIKEVLKEFQSNHQEELYMFLKEDLLKLNEVCRQHGLEIFNSNQKDFTDEIDASFSEKSIRGLEADSIDWDE